MHRKLQSYLIIAAFRFLVRYRQTALGPLWLIIGPSLFIASLGELYAQIGAVDSAKFVPHLSVGLVLWTLISGFVIQAPNIYPRNKPQIMQGGLTLGDIVVLENGMLILSFLHQVIIIVAILIIYRIVPGWGALLALPGLAIISLNGYWVSRVFGILGARYGDVSEIFQAIMRIAFLATPILWVPNNDGRGGIVGHFLNFNPFYHFTEIVRAPLLGTPIEPTSWIVCIAITLLGLTANRIVTKRYDRFIPLWI